MDRKRALTLLKLDASATKEQTVSAFCRLAAELDERTRDAQYTSQKTACRTAKDDLQAALAVALTGRGSSKRGRARFLAAVVLLVVLLVAASVTSPRRRDLVGSKLLGASENADARLPAEASRKTADPGNGRSAALARSRVEDPSMTAEAARKQLDTLLSLETELFGRISEYTRRVGICTQSAAAAPAGPQRKEIETLQRQAEAGLHRATRLKALADAYVFEASVRHEIADALRHADNHLAAGRRDSAFSAYTQAADQITSLLAWVDQADDTLQQLTALAEEIERARSVFGPVARETVGVRAAFDEVAEQMNAGDNALAQGDLPGARTQLDAARHRLIQIKSEAAAGLIERARTHHNASEHSAAVRALDELLVLEPGHAEAETLRGAILFHRITDSIGVQLIFVPQGRFVMGSPADERGRDNDERQHTVTLAGGFYIAATEVTQSQWRALMETDPSHFIGDDLPVEGVSWEDATAFCRKLTDREGRTYRLPTEAEWEYACRAGTVTPFATGHTISTGQANYDGNHAYGGGSMGEYRAQTTPATAFAPNAWGLYDMHGNVWEWCTDGLDDVGEAPLSPKTGVAGRALRGGSWRSRPRFCRSANRVRDTIGDPLNTVGLRVVLESE